MSLSAAQKGIAQPCAAARRINQVNHRREYFRATPTEVREVLREHQVELLDFALDPVAEEYRASQAMRESVSG